MQRYSQNRANFGPDATLRHFLCMKNLAKQDMQGYEIHVYAVTSPCMGFSRGPIMRYAPVFSEVMWAPNPAWVCAGEGMQRCIVSRS